MKVFRGMEIIRGMEEAKGEQELRYVTIPGQRVERHLLGIPKTRPLPGEDGVLIERLLCVGQKVGAVHPDEVELGHLV